MADTDPPLHRIGHVEFPSSPPADSTPAPTVIVPAIQHGAGTQTDYGLIRIGNDGQMEMSPGTLDKGSTTTTGSIQSG